MRYSLTKSVDNFVGKRVGIPLEPAPIRAWNRLLKN